MTLQDKHWRAEITLEKTSAALSFEMGDTGIEPVTISL